MGNEIKITLNAKYRLITNIIIWTLSIFSIIFAFFSMPVPIVVMIAIIFVVIPLFINKIIFRYNILWIYPGLSDVFFRRLGFSWFYENKNNQKIPGFSILFERKYDAKYAYSIMKSWNYGGYKDTTGNISVNFIDEGDDKYSVFVYPGERIFREKQIIYNLKNEFPSNSEFILNDKIFIWIQNCGDYSERPELLEAFELIKESGKVLINTSYIVDNKIKSYAKRNFLIEIIRFIKRQELKNSDLESKQIWEDPIKKYPDNTERISKIEINNE